MNSDKSLYSDLFKTAVENGSYSHMISLEIQAFLLDRKSRNLSQNTILYYSDQLKILESFAESHNVESAVNLTPALLRECLVNLESRRSNGGVHAWYRAVKAFLRWYEQDEEPPGWKNPIKKVKPPKVSDNPLPGISMNTFRLLLAHIGGKDYYDTRNRAIFYFLLDTGVRVSELCAVQVGDVNMRDGSVIIRHGKGDKQRTVYMGVTCRREVMKYLRKRGSTDYDDPLFLNRYKRAFRRDGIEAVIDEVSKKAGVKPPSPHDFRRAFAVNMLRAGCDLYTLKLLMGHYDLKVLKRYLDLVDADLRRAPSVVDGLK